VGKSDSTADEEGLQNEAIVLAHRGALVYLRGKSSFRAKPSTRATFSSCGGSRRRTMTAHPTVHVQGNRQSSGRYRSSEPSSRPDLSRALEWATRHGLPQSGRDRRDVTLQSFELEIVKVTFRPSPGFPATARRLPDSSQNSPIAPETASEISFEVLRFHLNPRRTEGPAKLLVPKCDHRVDTHCAPRRKVTGKQSDTDQKNGDSHKRHRIGRPHTIKQPRHQVRHNQRANQSHGVMPARRFSAVC
jgi:hypothetical protein